MSYIGNEPIVSATRTITEVTATAGQTVFTANGGYTVGYIDVFLNGAQLQTVDFTATNGTTITLTEAAQVGDVIRLVAWGTFQSANLSGAGLLDGTVTAAKFASGQTPSFNGITFPATQVPSANANTLDDYEEGTFTPTLSFSSGSVTYLERSAQYTKIGRIVNCTIAIYLSAVSSPSGDLSITGMPFATGSGERFVSGFTIGLARGFTSSLTITGYISSGSSTIILAKNASNGSYTPLSGSDLGSNTGFYITLTYATT